MARKAGLGRGLDALFADLAPINEEEYLAESEEEMTDISPELSSSSTPDNIEKKNRTTRKIVNTDQADSNSSASEADSGKETQPSDKDRIIYIDINDIRPNSDQPRKNFNEEKLRELAGSIKENGVIQPLIVREHANGYELVAGERRWRASRIAELRKIPCIIRDFDDRQNAIVAIIENMQREDLDPIEEAIGLRSMTEKFGFTQEQVSASVGRSRTYIANSIRLLKLPEDIQKYISEGQMSAAHGRTIINIPDETKQKEIADKIIRNDLSVRATERLAERVKDELRPERKRRRKKTAQGAENNNAEGRAELTGSAIRQEDIVAVETELMTLIGTRVSINGDSSGKIELEYYSIDELNRLIDILREAFRRE